MKLTYDKISPLIDSQFPSFYREEGTLFVQFVKEYYSWLETTGNPLYHSRHLLDYRDIDTTLDEFIPHFQDKYLKGTPVADIRNQRDLIKHSRELYQTKGTVESLRMLFQMLFNEEINVYYPGDDILRASDGEWIVPQYVELSTSDRTISYLGKDVVGNISGARAFAERVDRRTYRGRTVDVLFLSNIRRNTDTGSTFVYGEYVTTDGVLENAPTVVGSLTSIDVVTTGANFNEGEVINIVSDRRGRQGRARVASVGSRTGEVNYSLISGGYGYTTTANVIVSTKVLSINTPIGVTSVEKFPEFSVLEQPLMNVAFSSANVTFATGDYVYGTNSLSGIIASGFVMSANNSSNWLLVSPHSTAKLGLNTITGASTTGSFQIGEAVYQSNASGNAAVGFVVTANSTYVDVDQRFGPFTTSVSLYGANSGCVANTATVTTYAYNSNNFANTNITKIIVAGTTGGATKGTVTNLTANGTVVGANNSAIGVFQTTNSFVGGQWARVYDTTTQATAEVMVVSTGAPGGFSIGGIANAETIAINTDTISGYLATTINAASYGLPANTSANLSSVVGTALTKSQYTIGTVVSLAERNPGSNNTAKPFVVEIEKGVAAYNKPGVISCTLTDKVGYFSAGEPIVQQKDVPAVVLTVSGIANGPGPSANTFQYGIQEMVRQVRADGNTVFGELYMTSTTGASGNLYLYVANTANTFDTTAPILGIASKATATVTSVGANSVTLTARGTVSNTGANVVSINVLSFRDFERGLTIQGTETGTTANVSSIYWTADVDVLGNNVYVDPIAGTANGTLINVDVVDSGILYEDGETVTLESDGNPLTATGVARVDAMGTMEGFWRGDRGTLDSTKRIQDNEYYQEYSYEIQSGVDRVMYEAAVNSITHVAGTKMFSKYDKKTISPNVIANAPTTHDNLVNLVMPFSNEPRSLIPTSPYTGGYFGLSTAMNAERLLVGQPNLLGSSNSASVSVYTLATGAYEGDFTLPAITGGGQTFGHTIDAYGNTAVVGAPGSNVFAGRVHIYDIPSRTLLRTIDNPIPPYSFPMFGYDVAIYGSYCVVGAPRERISSNTAGQVYVFNVNTGATVYTKPNPSPYNSDMFGACVAINDDYFVVGAPLDDVNSVVDVNSNEGAVYVYRISDGALVRTITGTAGQTVGYSVGISGDTLAVGSNGPTAATARIDVYTLSTGVLQRTITNPETGSWFGKQLRIRNDTLMAADGSKVYMFNLTTGNLVYTFTNPNIYDISSADAFGGSRNGLYPSIVAAKPISLFGDYIAIPAPNEDDATNTNPTANNGVVYLYQYGTEAYWTTTANLQDGDIITQKNGGGTVVATGQFVERYSTGINNTNKISLSNTTGSFTASGNVYFGNTQIGTTLSIIRENY